MLKELFLPIDLLLSNAAKARVFLYRNGILKSYDLGVPTISVGNLTMGGTGKTPLVEHIATVLRSRGYYPAVLSRGYRGTYRGKVQIVSDSRGLQVSAEVAGDEPYLLARRLKGLPVVVSKDRRLAGEIAARLLGADVMILDDGFQHLKLRRHLDILTLDCTNPFGGGWMPPVGRLREPPIALERADVVVLTRYDLGGDDEEILAIVKRYNPGAACFRCSMKPLRFRLHDGSKLFKLEAYQGREVCVFCGIGNPDAFRATIEGIGLQVTKYFRFRDHHRYNLKDIHNMTEAARKSGAECLVTTEKDAVRLPEGWESELPVLYLDAKVVIREAHEFETRLISSVRKTRARDDKTLSRIDHIQ